MLTAVDMQSRVGASQSALLKLVLSSAVPQPVRRRTLIPELPHLKFAEADLWGFPDCKSFPGSDAMVQKIVVQM